MLERGEGKQVCPSTGRQHGREAPCKELLGKRALNPGLSLILLAEKMKMNFSRGFLPLLVHFWFLCRDSR